MFSLLGFCLLLPFLGLTGLAALAAFSVLYLNGVAPGKAEARGEFKPERVLPPHSNLGGFSLLLGFALLIGTPVLLLQIPAIGETITWPPADPLVLLRQGSGLLSALLFLCLVNRALKGDALLSWGGGKLSRVVFAFAALLPMLGIAAWQNGLLVHGVFGLEMPTELVRGLHDLQGNEFWASLLLVTVLAPILEEALFRGPVFAAGGALGRRTGRSEGWMAVLVSSLAFTVVHPPATWMPIFLLALALGCVRLHSGGLRDCILLHVAYNLVVFAFTFPTS